MLNVLRNDTFIKDTISNCWDKKYHCRTGQKDGI